MFLFHWLLESSDMSDGISPAVAPPAVQNYIELYSARTRPSGARFADGTVSTSLQGSSVPMQQHYPMAVNCYTVLSAALMTDMVSRLFGAAAVGTGAGGCLNLEVIS